MSVSPFGFVKRKLQLSRPSLLYRVLPT